MSQKRLRNTRIIACVVILVLIFCFHKLGNGHDSGESDSSLSGWEADGFSRRLTSVMNCTPRSMEQFPEGLFSHEQRQQGAILIHILVAIYVCGGFVIICADYFVPSLEILCDVLQIQTDVAGATFMAAGTGGPTLATAVIAIFIAKDDIGLGTIVGSAVYNALFVISACALGAGMVVYLHWWPLFRDSAFYAFSVIALAVIILDERVYWYEALALLLLYLLYIIVMCFNSKIEKWIVPKFQCCRYIDDFDIETIVLYEKVKEPSSNGTVKKEELKEEKDDDEWETQAMSSPDSDYDSDDDIFDELSVKKKIAPSDEPEPVFAIPDSWWKKILWLLALPLKLLLFLSIPDCRRKRWRKCFVLTFIMCLVWMTVFSYLLVWMITIIGFTMKIPNTIMALTFVAFGVSLPDVISSLIVVREGYGDMAVSNAIGSNVFNILICLGVPWILQTLVIEPDEPVWVFSGGLLYSTLTLIITVVFIVVATHVNGWKLTKKYGAILMIVYFLFTVISSLYELNVFGYVHPPECLGDY